MSNHHTKVIVNPTAGAKATYRHWPHIQNLLRNGGLDFDFQYTEGAGHATELARAAASDGCRFLVAVGGDGTIHEVANGLLTATHADATVLGIVSTGTGNDFIRSLGIPRDYISACKKLMGPGRTVIDVGLVTYRNNGQQQQRYFVNSAGVGFDGEVAETVLRLPKGLGHSVPFILGLLKTLPAYRNKDIKLNIDGRIEARRMLSVIVSNGAYFGGGMKIAPEAVPSDQQLDVITIGDINKLELLKVFPRVYKGTHITHPLVKTVKGKIISIESPQRILLQADGELLGEGPVSFEIVPSALCLAV
jgi:diacylglycerol kinase (ATP)